MRDDETEGVVVKNVFITRVSSFIWDVFFIM